MKPIFLLLLLFSFSLCWSQSTYQAGLLPSININKKFPNDWKLNFKVESRQALKSGSFDQPSALNYEYIQTDFSLVTAKKIDINKSLVVGYLMRAKAGAIINRSIQQFILTTEFPAFKLAQRIATDQTFAKGEAVKYRLRYRLSSEIPFDGQSVDAKEFYLKLNNEYLNVWQSSAYDFEIRLVPLFGYKFSDVNKLEVGMDYRIDSFLNDSSRNRFWLAINWFQSISHKATSQ